MLEFVDSAQAEKLAHLGTSCPDHFIRTKIRPLFVRWDGVGGVAGFESAFDAALEQYKYNKESYRIASEQLKVGVANPVDLLLQKTLFVQAQQAFIQAKYNELLTLKIYDFYRGIPIKL